jgi:hypothetical protein
MEPEVHELDVRGEWCLAKRLLYLADKATQPPSSPIRSNGSSGADRPYGVCLCGPLVE